MFREKDDFNEIYASMVSEAPGVAGNPTQQMAPMNTQQNPVQGGQQPQGQPQAQQQIQVDINAAATAVVSAVTAKAKDYQTASQILGAASAILQKKFNVKGGQPAPAPGQPPVQQ